MRHTNRNGRIARMQRGRHKGLYGWDYTARSMYMITLVTSPRSDIFGACREWGIERSAVAKAVYDAWMAIPRAFPTVKQGLYSIMPDHFHGILFLTEAGSCALDDVVCSFAEDAEQRAGRRLWDDGYHESVCLAKGQLKRMANYIMANPRRRWIKEHNPGLFQKLLGFRHPRLFDLAAPFGATGASRGCEIWDAATGEEISKPRKANRITNAFSTDLPKTFITGWRPTDGAWIADTNSGEHLTVQTAREWTAMGNPFLLDSPMIASVRISRFTPPAEFTRVKEKIAEKAERGAVIAGAWINALEREARDAAIERGGRVISFLAEGMGRYFKPHGRDLNLCADGRLLLVSPFEPPAKASSEREKRGKAHFEWLNAAARSIADTAIGWARK